MNKELNNESIEKLAEYDFSKGVLGKYAKQYAEGTNVVLLDPDMAKVFRLLSVARRDLAFINSLF